MIRASVLTLALACVSGFGDVGIDTCKLGQYLDFVGAYQLDEWNILASPGAMVLPAASASGNVTDCLKFTPNNAASHICVQMADDGELCFRVDDNANNPGTINHYFVSEGACELDTDIGTTCVPNADGRKAIERSSASNDEPPGNIGIVVNQGDYFCFNIDAPINVDLWCAPQAPGFSFPDM